MSLGWLNPLPFQVGGGPTPTEELYLELRRAVGTGGRGPEGGLRDLWWQCVAQGLAAAASVEESAALQFWPHKMIDALPAWEKFLGVPREATLVERQTVMSLAVAGFFDDAIPNLRAALQAIDEHLDVLPVPFQYVTHVQHGRAFGPLPGETGDAYASGQAARQATDWPNYSDNFVVHVVYLGGVPSQRLLAQTNRFLADALPSWVDFQVSNLADGTDGIGFYFDEGDDLNSYFDITSFDP